LKFDNRTGDFFKENLSVVITANAGISIEIFNIFWEKIPPRHFASQNATPQEGNLRIDISHLLPGVYFNRFSDKLEKFVKI
jgi:hypothetical protein